LAKPFCPPDLDALPGADDRQVKLDTYTRRPTSTATIDELPVPVPVNVRRVYAHATIATGARESVRWASANSTTPVHSHMAAQRPVAVGLRRTARLWRRAVPKTCPNATTAFAGTMIEDYPKGYGSMPVGHATPFLTREGVLGM